MSQSVKRLLERSRSSSSATYSWVKRAALSISALRLLVLHLSTFRAIFLTILFLWRLFTVTSPAQTPRFRRTFTPVTPRFLWRAFFASIATFADRLFFPVVGSATGSLSWATVVFFPFAAIPAPTDGFFPFATAAARLLLLPTAPCQVISKQHCLATPVLFSYCSRIRSLWILSSIFLFSPWQMVAPRAIQCFVTPGASRTLYAGRCPGALHAGRAPWTPHLSMQVTSAMWKAFLDRFSHLHKA